MKAFSLYSGLAKKTKIMTKGRRYGLLASKQVQGMEVLSKQVHPNTVDCSGAGIYVD